MPIVVSASADSGSVDFITTIMSWRSIWRDTNIRTADMAIAFVGHLPILLFKGVTPGVGVVLVDDGWLSQPGENTDPGGREPSIVSHLFFRDPASDREETIG